jgi:hypothetical protein
MGSEAEALRLRVLAVSEKFMPAEMAGQQAGQPSSRLLYAAADPTDSGWAPPRWQCLGGCFTSSPAAIVDTAGLVHLFARGCDRALWRLSQQAHPVSMQPVSRAPAPHPSNLPSLEDGQPARERLLYAAGDPAAKAGASPTPAAAGWAAEGAAEDGEDEWQSNDARWGEWASMGGIITSAPAASVDAEGMLHVFCRGITRALTHLRQRWNGTAVAWEAWESLGGALASGPQQRGLSDGSNFINLYVRGSDRAVWRKIEQANVTADPAGRRLGVRWSWLRGGLQWRAEVDFPTEVSMLWGHVASCRLTRPRRSRISCCSPDHRHRLCRTRDTPPPFEMVWRSDGDQ